MELKKNSDFFQCFMEDGKTVEEFCATEVEPMYRESDHIHITAITRGEEKKEFGAKGGRGRDRER
jgi:hypothetical protein